MHEGHQAKIPTISITRPKTAHFPFNHAFVVKLQISDAIVHQVFIDNESEGNMLFGGMAERMGVLHKVNFRRASIQTFDGTPLYTIGRIKLMVQAKPSEHLMNFHVMDCPSPNNTILSREWLHRMGKIPLANSPFPAI
ncbi:hypothetical protein COP2_013616 [Malus domestica]